MKDFLSSAITTMQVNVKNMKLFNQIPNIVLSNLLPKDIIHHFILPYHEIHCPQILNILTDDFEFYFDRFLFASSSELSNRMIEISVSLLSSPNHNPNPIRFSIPLFYHCPQNTHTITKYEYDFNPSDHPLFSKNIHALSSLSQRIYRDNVKAKYDEHLSIDSFKPFLNGEIRHHYRNQIGPIINKINCTFEINKIQFDDYINNFGLQTGHIIELIKVHRINKEIK